MKAGQSKYGYGKSKELVMQCHAKGMNMSEIAKVNKMSYASVYNVVRRNGVLFPTLNRRKHGFVKDIVLIEHELGLTPREIIVKHNLKKYSVYSVYRYCGIKPIRKK